MTSTDIDEARAIEAEADTYPDERGEILLEAAAAWFRAGDAVRGAELLAGLVADGGEDGCYARVELAEHHLGAGRTEEAYAQLTALAHDPGLNDAHCTLAAELLDAHGDLDESLLWYDRFVARLAPERLDALRGPDAWMQMASLPLRGRRDVRERLGLPPDATDELIPSVEAGLDQIRELLAGRPAPRGPVRFRILTFQRAERAEARRRWPDEYEGADQEYYPAAERDWRDRAEHGARIQVVPGVVAELVAFAERTGGSPTDGDVKTRYSESVPVARMIDWPPGRNERCWCGSGVKYKKCCGSVR